MSDAETPVVRRPADPAPHEHRLWWQEAIATTIAGALFAVVLSIALVLLQTFAFRDLERMGGDLTMRVYALATPLIDRFDDGGQAGRYIFIDVDTQDACEAFLDMAALETPGKNICAEGSRFSIRMVERFVGAVQRTRPKVAIVDWSPPDDQQPAFIQALVGSGSAADRAAPWVLAPSLGTLDVGPGGAYLRQNLPPGLSLAPGPKARLATAASTISAGFADGLLRSYPATVCIDPNAGERCLARQPTIPVLAALYLDPVTVQGAECRFFPPADIAAATRCRHIGGDGAEGLARLVGEPDAPLNSRPIFFTLPNDAAIDLSGTGGRSVDIGRKRYLHVSASSVISAGDFQLGRLIRPHDIVILGSSGYSSEDVHATPLGAMSGSEVMLNAVRTFREFSPREPEADASAWSTVWKALLERGFAILISTGCFLPGWLLIYRIGDRPARRRASVLGALADAGRGSVQALIFLGSLALALILEFGWTIFTLKSAFGHGDLINSLTPALALGLEGFAEGATWLNCQLERSVWSAFDVVSGRSASASVPSFPSDEGE